MDGELSEASAEPSGTAAHHFVVGQDVEGHWLAVETHGLGGGIFITRDAALHYALHETFKRPGGISLTARPITLT